MVAGCGVLGIVSAGSHRSKNEDSTICTQLMPFGCVSFEKYVENFTALGVILKDFEEFATMELAPNAGTRSEQGYLSR